MNNIARIPFRWLVHSFGLRDDHLGDYEIEAVTFSLITMKVEIRVRTASGIVLRATVLVDSLTFVEGDPTSLGANLDLTPPPTKQMENPSDGCKQ